MTTLDTDNGDGLFSCNESFFCNESCSSCFLFVTRLAHEQLLHNRQL
jgi:hypothetical protein